MSLRPRIRLSASQRHQQQLAGRSHGAAERGKQKLPGHRKIAGLHKARAVFHAISRTIALHYTVGPGNGSFVLTFPDGSTALINCDAPAPSAGAFEYTFPGGERDLRIQPMGNGPITILGENNLTGNPGRSFTAPPMAGGEWTTFWRVISRSTGRSRCWILTWS